MSKNYTIYHLHSDLSNGVTNVDSVTKYEQYVEKARELGMTALAFSEHGNIFEWYFKKCAIEKAGMKYIHAVEAYVTMNSQEKVRDNYHCVLIARNYEGVKEINKMMSLANNRSDTHFYYYPRITIEELEATSDNIIITSACLGGALNSSTPEDSERFLNFLIKNKERCFLEIQHHDVLAQISYNNSLVKYSEKYGIKLIAGTDTHSLDARAAKGRLMLQKSKNVHFDDEEKWDLVFKSYDELCEAYKKQNSLSENIWMEAINNTNVMADMVESFELDLSNKYPNIYNNPSEEFKKRVYEAVKSHPYASKRHGKKLFERIDEELAVYDKTGATPYMLLKDYLCQWEKEHDIHIGYGRGSVSGSEIAYVLGITEMDSMKFDLNFFRELNCGSKTL